MDDVDLFFEVTEESLMIIIRIITLISLHIYMEPIYSLQLIYFLTT